MLQMKCIGVVSYHDFAMHECKSSLPLILSVHYYSYGGLGTKALLESIFFVHNSTVDCACCFRNFFLFFSNVHSFTEMDGNLYYALRTS